MRFFAVLVAVFVLASNVEAAPFDLTLSPQNGEPLSLNVGETTLVDVVLSGIDTAEALDSLAATVSIGTGLSINSIIQGPIVPNPLDDPLDLLTSTAGGVADVAFLTFGTDAADHISSDGVFFTIEIAAEEVGDATLSFTFSDATLFNAAAPDQPLATQVTPGSDLSVEVVVPEPTGGVLAGVAVSLAAFGWRSRRQTVGC